MDLVDLFGWFYGILFSNVLQLDYYEGVFGEEVESEEAEAFEDY